MKAMTRISAAASWDRHAPVASSTAASRQIEM
jgi:hypothetical protein